MLPSGAAGAVIVAAWLVEAKQSVVENMAPVLTMLFTPLFAVMLTVAAITYAVSGVGGAFDRELLGVFDALLVVVLGLVLYAMSAREPSQPPGLMDRIQLVAVVSALVLDVMVLGAMVARIGDLGFTPEPRGGARPQPRPAREPGGGPRGCRCGSSPDGAPSTASSGGRPPTCRSSRSGRRPSSSVSPRCSPSPDGESRPCRPGPDPRVSLRNVAQDPAERGVFVNYRRTDTGWAASVVTDALRRRLGPSAEVFLDNRSIGLGESFAQVCWRRGAGSAVSWC